MVQVVRKTNTAAWNRLDKALKDLRGTDLKVGWFSSNRYKNGRSVAANAVTHEFGSPSSGIPPRPFMRPTVAREENNWRRFIEQEAPKIIAGSQTVEGMLDALGLNIAGEIGRSISEVFSPPLKPATIRAKLRKLADSGTLGKVDKPLIETGLMFDSVTHTVGKS